MENFKDYMLAGKAIFTVESTKIDKRFTYKVKKLGHFYKVSFLYEPDKYRHMCLLDASHDVLVPFVVKCGIGDIRFKMFNEFCKILNSGDWPDTCKVYKSIYCARCGRRLTTPESIEDGLGPNCKKYVYKEQQV